MGIFTIMWEVKQISENEIHVIPKDDVQPHSEEISWKGLMHGCWCGCGVRYEFEGEKAIVIHSSFDGREGLELVKELLK